LSPVLKLMTVIVAVLLLLVGFETYLLVTRNSESSVPIRVACVGDSITAGTEYPVYLWELLGSGYVVGNFGVGGATVAKDTGSSWVNETGFSVSLFFKPNIVILALGTNDANTNYNETNASFVADYLALIDEFKALSSKPSLYLMLPPPIFPNNGNLSYTLLQNFVIPSIHQVASQSGLAIIDAYSPLLDHSEYFADGVHPSVEGARIIAQEVHNSIIPAMPA
jgi:acyl-CoA thioesterase-1